MEAKYKVYLKKPVPEIDFEEFVKLYLNHRPAFGESFKRLRAAFRTFADLSATMECYMTREDFIEMLNTNGNQDRLKKRYPRAAYVWLSETDSQKLSKRISYSQ